MSRFIKISDIVINTDEISHIYISNDFEIKVYLRTRELYIPNPEKFATLEEARNRLEQIINFMNES